MAFDELGKRIDVALVDDAQAIYAEVGAAGASKWIIDSRPQPTCRATPVASGSATV